MTTGNLLYILMMIRAFILFAAVLAYQSSQRSRPDANRVSRSKRRPAPDDALTT